MPPDLGANDKCPIVGVLPVAEYPHQEPYPGGHKTDGRLGLFGPGHGRRELWRHGKDLHHRRLVLRTLWGIAWDKTANKWQMQELMQATFQFTAGAPDEKGYILAVNCFCFYTDDKGPVVQPAGRLCGV